MVNILLFFQFAKFGALCFGGGYMIIPLLMTAYVEKTPVFTLAEFGNLLSISQITPGAVSVNTATYVGFLQNGLAGALFASIGLVVPTLLLATLAIHFMNKWRNTWVIQGILSGARLAALAMVVFAVFIFMGMSVFNKPIPWSEIAHLTIPADFHIHLFELFICVGSFILVYLTRIPITFLLFCAALLGVGFSFIDMKQPFVQIDARSFDVDGCLYGESGSWTGACSCYPFYGKSGTYCDESPQEGNCLSVTDCRKGFYCNTDLNTSVCLKDRGIGHCFQTIAYPLIHQKKPVLISKSLLNWQSATTFCQSLGDSWRLATRADFNCSDNGPGCVGNVFLIDFQKTAGIRGFLWLDEASACQAYYMDLNDGNIYQMDKNKATNSQAVCIDEKGLK